MSAKYYTVEQVSEMVGLHVKTVRRYIREGKLKAHKVGKQWRITGHDLSNFTEGEVSDRNTLNSNSIELKTNSEENQLYEKVKVSAVVDIEVSSTDEASRISNMLMAVMNHKDPKYGVSTMNIQFLESDRKIRVMIWGSIHFIENILGSISVITS